MKNLPDQWTPAAWVTEHRSFIEDLLEKFGGTWDEVVQLTEDRTYDQFCEAFGDYFARKILNIQDGYN